MLIELAEYLRCPADHEEAHLVVATGAMKRRAIVFGTIGCPVCKSEYLVVDGIVRFGEVEHRATDDTVADADAVLAGLGLDGPGGYVVLVGSAGRLAEPLGTRMPGVHFVALNPPGDVAAGSRCSIMTGAGIPLRDSVARGVVVGAEWSDGDWLTEATRVLLPGRRLVVLAEDAPTPERVVLVAAGHGVWVGTRA